MSLDIYIYSNTVHNSQVIELAWVSWKKQEDGERKSKHESNKGTVYAYDVSIMLMLQKDKGCPQNYNVSDDK